MATVVEGEASESDDEFEDSFNEPVLSGDGVKDSPSTSMSSRDSYMLAKSLSENDAVSDISSVETQQKDKLVINHKYKSLLQKKLVDEMFSLRGQVETIAHKSYSESTKQMRQLVKNADALTNNLKKSTYQLQLLTNDLFRLEDQIDLVNEKRPLAGLTLPAYLTPASTDS